MDNPVIFQILLALVAIFFMFLTYMNTKTWRWLHVTMTFLVFLAIIPFGLYAALTLRTRAAWVGEHTKLEKQTEEAQQAADLAINGPITDVKQESDSVVNLRANLGRTVLDRGRVWRDGITGVIEGTGVRLNMVPPADPAVPAPGPAPKHNIVEKTVLFAFASGEMPGEPGIRVPVAYLGEYRVTEAPPEGTTIKVEPTMPPTEDQVNIVKNQETRWILYEVCPADNHQIFAGMTEQQLTTLLPQQATGLPPQQYQKFIAQFLRDGTQADEATDPPENVWIEVKFVKEHKVTVDAASEGTLDFESPFNSEGQARLDRYRRAGSAAEPGTADFAAGETAIFDKATAEQLIADGIAEKVRPIYRRSLIDFETKFQLAYGRFMELNNRITALTNDMNAVKAAEARAVEQEKLLGEYKAKMTDDLAKMKFELTELTAYNQTLAGRVGEVRAELVQLFHSNKALSAELAALNAKMTDQIERRTQSAANP
jgi:hypothetical protein